VRIRDSPKAGVSCLIYSGAQHLLYFLFDFRVFKWSEVVVIWTTLK
jgi:hypothetical protein